jgi:hypothetical protein
MGITLHPYTMGGNGLESRYEIAFDPISAKDIPGLGGRLRKWGDRLGTATRAMSPYHAGPRHPITDAPKCGILDGTLQEENPALEGKRLKYDEALAALKEMYRLHPEMKSLYYASPELFLDAALVKGRSNWQWQMAEYIFGEYKDHE